MARILISWIAMANDFSKGQIALDGPTYRFHQNFYAGYEKHILLTTEGDTPEYPRGLKLISNLNKDFRDHKIELISLDLPHKAVVDFNRIHSAVYPILLKHKDYEVDIFVSPGTATMQVVWHFLHMESGIKTRLLQTIKPEDTESGNAELLEIQMRKSPKAEFLIIQENLAITDSKSGQLDDYCITESLRPSYDLAGEIALTNKTTVLIQGETGTGKEHLAKEIHKQSGRKEKPFVAVNCGAISPELLESRLFGYEKGAFTGALKSTDGYFHAANKGTIFLDEIGDINPHMQVALLRVLQEGEIQRVGSNKSEKVDVRVIGATNKDLYEECRKGNFRWDLYYRLYVADISIPPLRERSPKDIEILIDFFNHKFQNNFGNSRKLITFTSSTMKTLLTHSWPGNVRELQNFVERCYAHGLEKVEPKHLASNLKDHNPKSYKLDDVIREHIGQIVENCHGNLSLAKDVLGLGSVNTVKKYLRN